MHQHGKLINDDDLQCLQLLHMVHKAMCNIRRNLMAIHIVAKAKNRKWLSMNLKRKYIARGHMATPNVAI